MAIVSNLLCHLYCSDSACASACSGTCHLYHGLLCVHSAGSSMRGRGHFMIVNMKMRMHS